MAKTKPVQSLLRGIDILQILAACEGGMRLQDIAARVDLKTPTVHNLLCTLALRGLVERRENCMYVIGAGVAQIAGMQYATRSLQLAGESVLRLGAADYRPFVNYCRVTASQIQLLLRVSPDSPGVVQRPAGWNNSLYSTATGLAVLAFAPEYLVLPLREAFPFEEHGVQYWGSRERLAEAVERARAEGVAVCPWQGAELFKVAMLVHGCGELGALGVAVPMSRASEEKVRKAAVGHLQVEVDSLSRSLNAG